MKKIKATFLLLGLSLTLQATLAVDTQVIKLTDAPPKNLVHLKDNKSYNSPAYNITGPSSILQDPVLNAATGGMMNSMMMGANSDYYSANMLRQQQAEYASKQTQESE